MVDRLATPTQQQQQQQQRRRQQARLARPAARLPLLALLLALAAAALARPAAAHGVMLQPPSRNWLAYLEHGFNWAHGLSAGGAQVVSDSGKMTYPTGRRGYCGDPYNETRWDRPGRIMATYLTGQTINLDVVVAINHLGKFAAQVCPLDAKPGDGKCQSLTLRTSAHNWTKSWYLPHVRSWTGGNAGHEGPRYGDGTFFMYRLPEIRDQSGWGCRGQRLCDQFKGMWVYRTQWQLPANFTCDHCKLQWHWVTGHTCWPPCDDGNPMPACQNKQVYPTCGTNGAQYPEEFFNCADVRIAGDNAKVDLMQNLPPWNGALGGSNSLSGGVWGEQRLSVMNEKEGPAASGHKLLRRALGF